MIKPLNATVRRPWWPWLALALGLAWTVIIRVPLIVNAEDHLDSDLAVNGLTLLDAVHGAWRWHYPATPHMGILPVLASFPQALAWGPGPVALVSGGTVLWALVVVSTFWLAWRAFGPTVAGWAVLPLACSSLGTIWLSGRITGGHLLALAWHTMAFVGLLACLRTGRRRSAFLLGVWCGVGLYIDTLFVATIVGLAGAAVLEWLPGRQLRSGIVLSAAFLGGLILGAAPREIGRLVDPYDAYPWQFEATTDAAVIVDHAALLGVECLPRLIAGTGLQRALQSRGLRRSSFWPTPGQGAVALMMLAFMAAVVRLLIAAVRCGDPARRAVARGTLVSGAVVVAGFLVNLHIYNSDNYRYLVFLVVPWSLGFGLVLDDLRRRGAAGRLAAVLAAMMLAAGMTVSAFRWYRETRHYLDDRGLPSRRDVAAWSELRIVGEPEQGDEDDGTHAARSETIPDDVTHIFGGYWDVYRISFLSGSASWASRIPRTRIDSGDGPTGWGRGVVRS